MTTLHRVAEASKKILVGFAIGIGSIIFFALLIKVIINLKQAIFPTPPPPPTVRYGKIPSIPFPQSGVTTKLTYSLDTISGSLPTFPNQIPVYKITQPAPSLLSFDNTNTLAQKNGFTESPTQLTDSLYQWRNNNAIATTLLYDTLSGDFTISSNYLYDPSVLAATNLPDQSAASDFAKSFLGNFNAFPSDIDESKTTVNIFDIQNGKILPADSLSNAKLLVVDFFQQDINTFSLFYPNFPTSTIHVVIASGNTGPQVVQAKYSHKIIVTQDSSTYPIKTATQAYEEFKSGGGYIANYDGNANNMVIRNVILGYYVGENPQQYVYPIIIFEGDHNFYGYVSAVTNEWIQR